MTRAALCIVLGIWCGGLLAQGFNVPPEKREARKSTQAPASRPERPQRKEAERASLSVPGKTVEATPRQRERDTAQPAKRREPERASISRPEAAPQASQERPRRTETPARERASISRTVESSRTAPVERERPPKPAPVYRQPKPQEEPVRERAPIARTVESAKTAPIERESRPPVAEILVCAAQPQCTAVPASCRPVEHSYGGGNRAAARADTVKSCRLANNFNACCAQSCDLSVHCRSR